MATITGISASKYYVNNPIWVDVDTTGEIITEYFKLRIVKDSDTVFNAKYYTLNNIAYFDLAEVIKGIVPEPGHPNNPISGQILTNNSVTVTIYLPSYTQAKTFYRGGEDSLRTNIQVPASALLSESEKIPVWNFFPSAKYYLNSEGQIIYSNILANNEIERRRSVTCNPVFLRFLNTKGGYSFWLFDEWDLTKTTKKGTVIKRRINDLDLGLQTDHMLTVSTRAEERYISTLRALLQSPEVAIYNIQDILVESNPQFVQTFTWTRIYNQGGSMKWNSSESVHEFDFKFALNLKNNPTLIW